MTINALTLLFDRLRKRAKMTEERINPSRLRDTFAVRYLQAGGEPEALRVLLGLTGMESIKRYEQISIQQIEHEPQRESTEEHQSKAMAASQKSTQPRRRSSSAATRSQQLEVDRTHQAGKKKPFLDAGENPSISGMILEDRACISPGNRMEGIGISSKRLEALREMQNSAEEKGK